MVCVVLLLLSFIVIYVARTEQVSRYDKLFPCRRQGAPHVLPGVLPQLFVSDNSKWLCPTTPPENLVGVATLVNSQLSFLPAIIICLEQKLVRIKNQEDETERYHVYRHDCCLQQQKKRTVKEMRKSITRTIALKNKDGHALDNGLCDTIALSPNVFRFVRLFLAPFRFHSKYTELLARLSKLLLFIFLRMKPDPLPHLYLVLRSQVPL